MSIGLILGGVLLIALIGGLAFGKGSDSKGSGNSTDNITKKNDTPS